MVGLSVEEQKALESAMRASYFWSGKPLHEMPISEMTEEGRRNYEISQLREKEARMGVKIPENIFYRIGIIFEDLSALCDEIMSIEGKQMAKSCAAHMRDMQKNYEAFDKCNALGKHFFGKK